MTDQDFRALVAALRKAQKNYFRATAGTPDKSRWLEESKRLEKQVDDALKDHGQKELFGAN